MEEQRVQIQEQCDALISEIQTRRGFFLSDLEYEEKSKKETLQREVAGAEAQMVATQSLVHYGQEVLKENDSCAFLQVTQKSVINDIHDIKWVW